MEIGAQLCNEVQVLIDDGGLLVIACVTTILLFSKLRGVVLTIQLLIEDEPPLSAQSRNSHLPTYEWILKVSVQ